MNLSLNKKILIILFLLIFSVSVNAQTINQKVESSNISVGYPEEILIEKGWTSYASFSVNNNGDINLHNVIVVVEGTSNWFELQTNKSDVVNVNETKDFVSKISIPYETAVGNYKFYLNINADEIGYKKDFTVRVFDTRDDLLLYQINTLRGDLKTLEGEADKIESKGVNLTTARSLFYEIESKLGIAEEQVNGKMYSQLTETIREIEKLFIKARFEVSNPPKKETEAKTEIFNMPNIDILLLSYGVGIILLATALIYLIRKIKIENKVRLPNLRIKELIVENKKLKELGQEIEKIKESQEIIEEEYKSNMISKESYDELKVKYQERLIELEAERRRLRGY